jgi:hypothetical protein
LRLIRILEGIHYIPFFLVTSPREAGPEIVSKRPGKHDIVFLLGRFEFVKRLQADLDFIGGFGGSQVHRTGDTVLAEQGTLRAAQDFHPGQVEERGADELLSAVIDAVDVLPDRLFKGLVLALADSPDIQLGADTGFCHREIGNKFRDVGNLVDIAGFNTLVVYDIHRQRNVTEVFLTLLCRHHNFLEHDAALGFCCIGMPGDFCKGKGCGGSCELCQSESVVHLIPPRYRY